MNQKSPPTLSIDDNCIMCNKFVLFILRIDKKEQIYFITLSKAQKEKNTLIFCVADKEYQRSDGVIQLFKKIGGIWKIVGLLFSIFPRFLRDKVYTYIANNRYRFGKKQCTLPTNAQKARILSD